jgi:hypothetical protein
VPKHEQYEELCTLAMIGEVSPAEVEDLRQHLSQCPDCQEQYREFTQFLLPQLSISSDQDGSFETGYSGADHRRLRREFLAGAEKRGRSFSPEAKRGTGNTANSTAPVAIPMRPPRTFYRWSIAASVAAVLFASGYLTHVVLIRHEEVAVENRAAVHSSQPAADPSAAGDSDHLLRAENEADARTIAALRAELAQTAAQLETAQKSLQADQDQQSALQAAVADKNGQIASLTAKAGGDEQSVTDLRAQVARLQGQITDNQGALSAAQLRVRDLNDQLTAQTTSLDHERELLSVGKDVRDLMGARNLHIIDVHDSNGAGKNQKSFGRIFYTEGESLIFYAFDLDDKRVENSNYAYAAWGEEVGRPSSVKSLGVLYVDDKTQRRWSLKVDDPHQLAEINSVFVTVEPHGHENDKPQGKRILFAFLGGEANHP